MDDQYLDWSAKQGRILTAGGKANLYYRASAGYPFLPEELPHHHLEKGDSREVFRGWARRRQQEEWGPSSHPIVGAWKRSLFVGRWEHSTENDEVVYNVQTSNLFVDLRIPRCKPVSRWKELGQKNNYDCRRILESMSDHDLRLFARQHVFGGYSLLTPADPASMEEKGQTAKNSKQLPSCTRHHCIDWNYIPGKPRPRPNKWYIEGKDEKDDVTNNNNNSAARRPFSVWRELSHATDSFGQCYYSEQWERIESDYFGKGLRLAMRTKDGEYDAIIVAVGDHFNYIKSRQFTGNETSYPHANNLVELVDSAIECGDRSTAISYLTLDGGHGTISSGWRVDCSIRPWNHGRRLFECISSSPKLNARNSIHVRVEGVGMEVKIGDTSWEVLECSIAAFELEEQLLQCNVGASDNFTSRL